MGTGILKLLIDDEDLINEESQESCDQYQLKVSHGKVGQLRHFMLKQHVINNTFVWLTL